MKSSNEYTSTRRWDVSILYRKTKCKQNRFKFYHKLDWINENPVKYLGTHVRWRNSLVRWHHTTDILNLGMQKLANFVSWHLEASYGGEDVGRDGECFFVSLFIDHYRFYLSRATVCCLIIEQCIWMIKRQFFNKKYWIYYCFKNTLQ